ncbi:MAG: DUF5685 family protein [Oscillospiraceae bacterium]|nr:DUF5685 family protein [Oscillospiraceae bacterium]
MFGYVIPVQQELKVKELDQFRAAYCGLCHSLQAHYGLSARFILNYDFTFLAILLSVGNEKVKYSNKRCIAHPLKKRKCCVGGDAFHQAAGFSVILTWWRLRDGVQDSGLFKGLSYRGAGLLLRRAYKKAAQDFPGFDTHCRARLEQLRILEQANSGELDQVADAFAGILSYAAHGIDEDKERTLMQLLYHTGRWIYLIDAYDDLEQDKQSGNFNPLVARFQVGEAGLTDTDRDWISTTLHHSANLITSAYNLLPAGAWRGILENIIYLGFPAVTERVLNGQFRRRWGRWERKDTNQ